MTKQWKATVVPTPDFEVDLVTLENKDGVFACPRCEQLISPDDDSDQTYTILDTIMASGHLSALIIECRDCNAVIRLIGFDKV